MHELNVVTGAFGYTGKYITRLLLAGGARVKTLTGHPERSDLFGGQVIAAPFNFDDPAALTSELSGASTLYNTYWVRFSRGEVTFDRAVENTRILIRAAKPPTPTASSLYVPHYLKNPRFDITIILKTPLLHPQLPLYPLLSQKTSPHIRI